VLLPAIALTKTMIEGVQLAHTLDTTPRREPDIKEVVALN
jgi:hypothetical protein